MNFQQIVIILLARRRLILKVFALVVVLGTVVTVFWPTTYTATSTVVVDVKAADPVTGALVQGMVMPSFLATQVDIITSERVSRRVIKMLKLDKDPDAIEAWKQATKEDYFGRKSGADIETFYAAQLKSRVKAEPSRVSNVIEVRFKSDNPKRAAEITNAFVQAYLDTNLELIIEPAKKYSTWFTEQTKLIQEKMAREQDEYFQFQKDKGIVSMDEKFDVEATHLSDLSAQLTQVLGQQSEARTRQTEATNGKLETIPEVLNSLDIQNLRTTIANAEGKLLLASNTLGVNHPQVKEQKAELDTLKKQLNTEMSNVANSLKTNVDVSDKKVAEIRAQLDAQRKRVLDLKKQRDEANNLQATLQATQLDYNNLRQHLTQSSLQSQSPDTNISVLTVASVPTDPSMPKTFLFILGSIFMGGVLGVGAALLTEQSERPIRSEADLAELGFPVLVVLTKGKTPVSRWQFWRVSNIQL